MTEPTPTEFTELETAEQGVGAELVVRDESLPVRDERGSITAEYAIMILVAIAFAGVLFAAIRQPEVTEMFVNILRQIAQFGARIR